ncbi:hypothetical protein DIPPA_58461, partial [Diplonema papillatum]
MTQDNYESPEGQGVEQLPLGAKEDPSPKMRNNSRIAVRESSRLHAMLSDLNLNGNLQGADETRAFGTNPAAPQQQVDNVEGSNSDTGSAAAHGEEDQRHKHTPPRKEKPTPAAFGPLLSAAAAGERPSLFTPPSLLSSPASPAKGDPAPASGAEKRDDTETRAALNPPSSAQRVGIPMLPLSGGDALQVLGGLNDKNKPNAPLEHDGSKPNNVPLPQQRGRGRGVAQAPNPVADPRLQHATLPPTANATRKGAPKHSDDAANSRVQHDTNTLRSPLLGRGRGGAQPQTPLADPRLQNAT